MATERLKRELARSRWLGIPLAGLLWTAGCSTPQGTDRGISAQVPALQAKRPVSAHKLGLPDSGCPIQQVQHAEQAPPPKVPPSEELPSPKGRPSARCPIDLTTALQLAGANNLQIALAAERIGQAQARLDGAEAQWLPSLNGGVGYNRHTGRVQDTRGEVVETERKALFVGGGPNLGPAALTGPAGPPARLFLGLPLADVFFGPLAERQQLQATNAALAATFNDTLLQVSQAYLDLVFAESQVLIADEAVKNAQELLRLVDSRVRAGTAPPADGLRAQAELAERQRQKSQSEEAGRV